MTTKNKNPPTYKITMNEVSLWENKTTDNESSGSIVIDDTDTDEPPNDDSYGEDNYDDIVLYPNNRINEIFQSELSFLDAEKENGQYILGFYTVTYDECNKKRELVYASGITAHSFFRYSHLDVIRYLFYYRIHSRFLGGSFPQIEIIKLHIADDGTYIAILKTYRLRIIQRIWKKRFQERQRIVTQRKNPQTQFYFQIHGKYPRGYNTIPSIDGMLVKDNVIII